MYQISASGDERKRYLDEVWRMYVATYEPIGMHVGNPRELLEDYQVWMLAGEDGGLRSFMLLKQTPLGSKVGLVGSDGSAAGKSIVKQQIGQLLNEPGVYAETSHAVRKVALRADAPIVCASSAGQVLGKKVEMVDDITYRRELGGLGVVEKTLFGQPFGVYSAKRDQLVCDAVAMNPKRVTPDDVADLDAHLFNELF